LKTISSNTEKIRQRMNCIMINVRTKPRKPYKVLLFVKGIIWVGLPYLRPMIAAIASEIMSMIDIFCFILMRTEISYEELVRG
jgi:hypothetical protein